jgi:hypothetical protein
MMSSSIGFSELSESKEQTKWLIFFKVHLSHHLIGVSVLNVPSINFPDDKNIIPQFLVSNNNLQSHDPEPCVLSQPQQPHEHLHR